jgi:holo-[acyl-carrier protein] synthase
LRAGSSASANSSGITRDGASDARGLAFLATLCRQGGGIKALGLGMRMPMTWRSVEILNDPSGRPVLFVQGELQRFVESKRLRLHVSVTDERSMAMAYVVAETEGAH